MIVGTAAARRLTETHLSFEISLTRRLDGKRVSPPRCKWLLLLRREPLVLAQRRRSILGRAAAHRVAVGKPDNDEPKSMRS